MCRMNSVYNTFNDFSTSFRNFLLSYCPYLSKTCLNILPEVLTSMASSLSSNTHDIALGCKGPKFDFIQPTRSIDVFVVSLITLTMILIKSTTPLLNMSSLSLNVNTPMGAFTLSSIICSSQKTSLLS